MPRRFQIRWLISKSCLIGLATVMSFPSFAEELRDPRLRDEDISRTQVSVEYALRSDGLYEYVYTVSSPEENLGRILTLSVDLSCDKVVPGVRPPPADAEGAYGSFSEDDEYVPATVLADYGQAGLYGVNAESQASWGVSLEPGSTSTGLRILSPAEPGLREYILTPFMDNDPSWDYPETPDPTIPWIEDFTVRGMIAGPGCPGVSPPVDSKGSKVGIHLVEAGA